MNATLSRSSETACEQARQSKCEKCPAESQTTEANRLFEARMRWFLAVSAAA